MTRNNDIPLGVEVLRLIARGMTYAEIGAALFITPETAKGRLQRLYVALGARTAAHAVAIAGVQRLLTAEDLRAAAETRRPGWQEGDRFRKARRSP